MKPAPVRGVGGSKTPTIDHPCGTLAGLSGNDRKVSTYLLLPTGNRCCRFVAIASAIWGDLHA